MKLRNLLNPAYCYRKLNYKLYESRHPNEPWIAQGAVHFCDLNLSTDHAGLEWGSGRSTLWFAQRLKTLTSVEHDEAWFNRVSNQIATGNVKNVSYLFRPLHHDASVTIPFHERLATPYVNVTEGFEEESLDFVAVDGHYREACIVKAIPKLRSGGLLLLDNSNWLPLQDWGIPASWELVHQSENVMTQTTIWRKH